VKPLAENLPARLLIAALLAMTAAAAVGYAEQPKDGLTDEERIALAELKNLRPHASEGFQAWFFDFGGDKVEEGYTPVTAADVYSPQKGWGWIYDSAALKVKNAWPYPRPGYGTPYGYVYLGNYKRRLYRDKFDIYTPLEVDSIVAFRRLGLDIGGLPDRGDIQRSMMGSQYVKEDAVAEFAVDVPNGEYSVLMEIAGMDWLGFTAKVENEDPYEFEFRGNPKNRVMFAMVKDGQLNLRMQASRMRGAYKNTGIWALGPGWNIAYIAIFQAKDEQGYYREDWRIIKNKFFSAKKAIYVNVNRLQARVEDFHIVLDERPHWDIHLQNHGLRTIDKYLRFYSLGNSVGGGGGLSQQLRKILTSSNYLAADRYEKSYYEDYPFELIATLNQAYNSTFFARPFFGGAMLEFMPKYLRGESPLMSSPDGRSLGRAPLGSKLQRELIKEFLEFLSAHINDHPSLIGYELWEELEDLPAHFGYDAESTHNYQLWLLGKYKDIAALNRAWGAKYESFGHIAPPPYATYGGGNYVNWQNFRGLVVGNDLKLCRDKIQELQPQTLSVGGGSRPTTGDECTWDWLTATDLTFQYGGWLKKMMYPAQKYWAQRGHQVAVQAKGVTAGASHVGGTSRNCPFCHFFSGVHRKGQRMPRGRQSWQRTDRETQIAVDNCNGYNSILHDLFHGMKSIMWEAQTFPDTHMIHYAKYYNDVLSEPYGEFRNEYNDLIFFAPQALEGPPVRICLPFLYAQRANELVYRIAPVVLPAQPLAADVGLLATAESTFPLAPRHGPDLSAFRIPLNNLSKLLDSLQTGAWGIREDIFEDIFKYKVVIAGPSAAAVTAEQAEKLKQYVAAGGTLVVINNGCSADGNTLYSQAESPIFGLDKLVGGKIVKRPESGGQFELRPGRKEGERYTYDSIVPYPGSTVIRKDEDIVTAIRSPDGRGYLLMDKKFGQRYYRNFETEAMELRGILADILKSAGVSPAVAIEGAAQPWKIYAGALKGQDSWTFAILNNSLETQKFVAKIQSLPPGDYSVLDVTGQRPLLNFTRQKSWYLEKDDEFKKEKFLAARISSEQLAQKGLPLECVSKSGRVLLLRSAKTDVWVNMPEYEMIGLTYQYHRKNPEVDKRLDARPDRAPVKVVVGSIPAPAEMDAARRIVKLLTAKNIDASIVADKDIKIKATHTEVKVPTRPGGRRVKPTYVMDVFDNEIVDTKCNLIVIGNENTNSLTRQLAKDGAYAYDKVLLKVTETFPGDGIGVIQVVESINNEGYDARHESRSAILLGGSDEAGTQKALARFLAVLTKGGQLNARTVAERYGFGLEKRPVYVRPKKKKKIPAKEG